MSLLKKFKLKKKSPRRYWDFSYINNFIKNYRQDIDYMELTMENDENVKEVLIEDGKMIHAIAGQYQYGSSAVDGVVYSVVDYPCMKVVYKGGNAELLRCYIDVNGIEPCSISRKRVR